MTNNPIWKRLTIFFIHLNVSFDISTSIVFITSIIAFIIDINCMENWWNFWKFYRYDTPRMFVTWTLSNCREISSTTERMNTMWERKYSCKIMLWANFSLQQDVGNSIRPIRFSHSASIHTTWQGEEHPWDCVRIPPNGHLLRIRRIFAVRIILRCIAFSLSGWEWRGFRHEKNIDPGYASLILDRFHPTMASLAFSHEITSMSHSNKKILIARMSLDQLRSRN